MNYQRFPLCDQLAAEYVLGTLHGAARRRFEQLLLAHPALRRAVADWEHRLNRLVVAGSPVPPPPEVWTALQHRLFPAESRRSGWGSLAFWRGFAVAGVLAVILILAPRLAVLPEGTEMSFAAIRGKQQEVLWTVALADDGQLHVNNLRAMAMPPDQRCLLWLKTGNSRPVMLGVLPDDGGNRTLPLPASVIKPTDGELWVTMQPMAPQPQPPSQPLYQTHWQAL
ncbi:MAG: anti-sigma factor [Candidatus Competibacter sp.]